MAKVPNGVETLPKISIALQTTDNETDRQTDKRQIDRRHTDRRTDDHIIANVNNVSSRSLKISVRRTTSGPW